MKQRIITAIVAAAVFLPIVIIGGIPFTILVYLMGAIATFELLRMKNIKIASIPGIISILLLWVILIPSKYNEVFTTLKFTKIEIVLLIVLFILTYTVISKNSFSFDDAGLVILAAMYIGFGFYYMIEIRAMELAYIFYAFVVIWTTDSGAYFVGRKLGKNKLWPEISPNKTIEGFVGGILTAIVFAFIFNMITHLFDSFISLFFVTLVVSVFGQIGDLVESALKRHYKVKDSGTILPGHGGILDRFDSMLFILPILYFLRLII
ncbi:phosphatidate cytidylyltransferase [Bacillus sinesaloumensis]|uniref:phosphatidate cytidylyltransferase n=1 Tax=Litchfieldia sinesaloumensis TaxID=1926280 RepID=UPI0009885411|nr:phosphatidate cytidylyltransferase [Bacillus sinesaloumensis]